MRQMHGKDMRHSRPWWAFRVTQQEVSDPMCEAHEKAEGWVTGMQVTGGFCTPFLLGHDEGQSGKGAGSTIIQEGAGEKGELVVSHNGICLVFKPADAGSIPYYDLHQLNGSS